MGFRSEQEVLCGVLALWTFGARLLSRLSAGLVTKPCRLSAHPGSGGAALRWAAEATRRKLRLRVRSRYVARDVRPRQTESFRLPRPLDATVSTDFFAEGCRRVISEHAKATSRRSHRLAERAPHPTSKLTVATPDEHDTLASARSRSIRGNRQRPHSQSRSALLVQPPISHPLHAYSTYLGAARHAQSGLRCAAHCQAAPDSPTTPSTIPVRPFTSKR